MKMYKIVQSSNCSFSRKKKNQEKNPKQSALIIMSQSLQQNINSSEHNCGTYRENNNIHKKTICCNCILNKK